MKTQVHGHVAQLRLHGDAPLEVAGVLRDAEEHGRKLMVEIRDAEGRHWLHCEAKLVLAETQPARLGVQLDAIALPQALVTANEPSTAPLGKVARRSKRGAKKLREESRTQRLEREARIRDEHVGGAPVQELMRKYELPEREVLRIVGGER